MSSTSTLIAAVVSAAVLAGTVAVAQVKVDPALPSYKATSGVSGNVSSIGSDTLNTLVTLWAEKFTASTPMPRFRSRGRAP